MAPNGWTVKNFSEIAALKSGGTPSKENPDYWDGDLPWISATSMHDVFVYDSDVRITEKGLANGSRLAKKNSILLLVRGSMLWKHIPVCLTKRDVAFNQDVKNIVTNNEVTTPFLFYNLKSQENRLLHLVVGTGIGAGKLDTDDLSSLRILIPPLSEQKKIAEILSTWDEAIAANEDLLANSRQRKKALMQKLLTGETRLPGFKGEWKNTSLSDIGYSYTGLSGKTKEDFGQGFPYIPYKNIFFNRKVDPDFLDFVVVKHGERQSLVQAGDILFTTSSETPEEVGMSSVLLNDLGIVYLNSFCFGFRPTNTDMLDPVFASFYFRSAGMRKEISMLAQGATRYNISAGRLMKLKLEIPSIPEQRAIAEILTVADYEIEALEHRINNLKLQKKALMQQLLTGKKRVKVDPIAA